MARLIRFPRYRVRRKLSFLLAAIMLPFVALGSLVNAVVGVDPADSQDAPQLVSSSARYTLCSGPKRFNCVVDGDTLWMKGTKVRVADIDAPEVSKPRCATEKALGNRATKRLLQLVNQGPFEARAWEGRDADKYGRKLRVLVRNGRSLGDIMVGEGLARTWTGRRMPWC